MIMAQATLLRTPSIVAPKHRVRSDAQSRTSVCSNYHNVRQNTDALGQGSCLSFLISPNL